LENSHTVKYNWPVGEKVHKEKAATCDGRIKTEKEYLNQFPKIPIV
jgi:hypothetical protein